MRIVLFSPVFVRPTETFIYDSAIELSASGAEVLAVAENRQTEREYPFKNVSILPRNSDQLVNKLFVKTVNLVSPKKAANIIAKNHTYRLSKVISDFQADVILAHYGHGGVAVAAAAQSVNVPLIVSFHGADASRRAQDPSWRQKYREMFEIATAVTGPSEYVRKKLVSLGCSNNKAVTLHNGIHLDRIPLKLRSIESKNEPIQFLFIGRLSAKKDPLTLIRSYREMLKMRPQGNSMLTIIGDGPLRADVAQIVKDLDLSNKVRLLGRQPHELVLQEIQRAHIYVQHSVTAPDGDEEGLPVSITEALAAGLPVVSTIHSGIPEVVRHGENGYLVNEGDIEMMATFMSKLADNPAKWPEFGQNGRQLLESEFSMPVVQRQLRSLLIQAAGCDSW